VGSSVSRGQRATGSDRSHPRLRPLVCDEPDATYERSSDEHGRRVVSAATDRLGLGDKTQLIPGHCDPTVNLYDTYVCIGSNRVEEIRPITARGALY
jgi:3-hydroxy-D-aspartate aldolase